MAFFPRSFVDADSTTSFHPLFRLLDDFDTYNQSSGKSGHQRRQGRQQKVFTPKFDVREVENAYELHGELPGIDQKDVNIEFADEHTLVIRGRSERQYTAGTPPQAIEGAAQEQKQIETHKEHQPTAEDDPNEPATPDTAASQLAKQEQEKKPEAQQPQAKYWISERSVGEFARTFSFPGRVDHDAVTASMKNGILSIVVPKAKKHEARKITISS
ncbi:HSP20-like chaperone [Xylogone sp. PMI_703]|nr:HSP20-like chaperone [Xylogone sp. PMI_703]